MSTSGYLNADETEGNQIALVYHMNVDLRIFRQRKMRLWITEKRLGR